jgi:putative NADH-flavin reductase
MKIAVFGATGTTGVIFVRQALKENHQLKLYCRPQSIFKLGEFSTNELVEIIQGGFDDDFTPAIRNVDVVVSFLGPGFNWPSGNPLEKVMIKIMETMRKEGVKRFITMGTPTIVDPQDKNSYKYKIMVYSLKMFQHNVYNDMIAIGNLFQTGNYDDLEWTVGRICILKNASEPTGHVHIGYVGDHQGSIFSQRADWAQFVLKEINEKNWIRKMPFLTSI